MRLYGLILLLSANPVYSQPSKIDFSRDVQPIFESRCQGCHGSQQQMAGLRLDSGDAILKGSATGAVIQPGKSVASKLMQRVSSRQKGFAMPPVGEPLSPGQIATLGAWIDQGAQVPPASPATVAGKPKSTTWAFQPVAHRRRRFVTARGFAIRLIGSSPRVWNARASRLPRRPIASRSSAG
jgi:hypothetical protein